VGFLRREFGSRSTDVEVRADTPRQYSVPIFDAQPGARVEVVGESFYQSALDRAAGGRTEHGPVHVAHIAGLAPEPSNPHDPNAVVVQLDGATVGHLSRTDAVAYRPVFEAVARMGYPAIGCHATLTGGWDRGGGDRGSIGVVLHLGTPRELLGELGVEVPGVEPSPGRDIEPEAPLAVVDPATLHPLAGRSVCFTGESGCTIGGAPIGRATQEALAINAGLSVLPRVTKKLDILVVSPAVGTTGKVTKAVEYGIPCVEEATFWRAVGVRID
jgi:hypothetical protein